MHRERMERLAALLERPLPKDVEFNMYVWAKKKYPPLKGCGTACCAAGLAGLDPWFRAQGLRTLPEMFGIGAVVCVDPDVPEGGELDARHIHDVANIVVSDELQQFFDIDEDIYNYIFYSEAYRDELPEEDQRFMVGITPVMVAAHVRKVLAHGGVPASEGEA